MSLRSGAGSRIAAAPAALQPELVASSGVPEAVRLVERVRVVAVLGRLDDQPLTAAPARLAHTGVDEAPRGAAAAVRRVDIELRQPCFWRNQPQTRADPEARQADDVALVLDHEHGCVVEGEVVEKDLALR